MTLRTRLLIGLVLLAAIGLSVTGVVTYHEQKSFLSKRVNEQLASALAVPQQFEHGIGNPNRPGSQHARSVPFGTYVELRFPDGTTETLSGDMLPEATKPKLPAQIPFGKTVTVHNPSYRVEAGTVSVIDSEGPLNSTID